MNLADVISVIPGRKTRGEFNAVYGSVGKLTRGLRSVTNQASSLQQFVNFATGISSTTGKFFSWKMLGVRMLIGALFLTMGIISLISTPYDISAISMIAMGGSLILGLFTRFTSTAFAAFFGYLAYPAIMSGSIPYEDAMTVITGLIFMIFGPGRISIDQLIRKGLFTISRRKRVRKPRVMTYRAYQYADSRI